VKVLLVTESNFVCTCVSMF